MAQDDLGSGYSSLLRLRHVAFDDMKIDQSLVRGTELAPGAARPGTSATTSTPWSRAPPEVHGEAVAGRGSDAHRAMGSHLAFLVSATR